MSRSVPSSPGDRKQGSIPVVGSAEDLVGRVNIFLQFVFPWNQFHENFREIDFTENIVLSSDGSGNYPKFGFPYLRVLAWKFIGFCSTYFGFGVPSLMCSIVVWIWIVVLEQKKAFGTYNILIKLFFQMVPKSQILL